MNPRTSETRTGTNAFTASYTVDGVGNRTAQTVGGNSTSFTLNSDDELTATSGGFTNSYTYNANGEHTGRTLGGTATSLSYDYDGQLTQITQGQTSTDFAYDALGRRFSRTAGGATTEFIYGAGGMALEKQGGSYTQAYSVGNGMLRRGSEYPLFDGHGSERTVTNSSQTVTGSVNFEAFGQVAGSSGSRTGQIGPMGRTGLGPPTATRGSCADCTAAVAAGDSRRRRRGRGLGTPARKRHGTRPTARVFRTATKSPKGDFPPFVAAVSTAGPLSECRSQ